jgi:hypothetical protein
MNLLNPKLIERFAEIGPQKWKEDPTIVARFHSSSSQAIWLAIEYDPIEHVCYGFVQGPPDVAVDGEWGYFSLDAMERTRTIPRSNSVQLDITFKETPLSEVMRNRKLRGFGQAG